MFVYVFCSFKISSLESFILLTHDSAALVKLNNECEMLPLYLDLLGSFTSPFNSAVKLGFIFYLFIIHKKRSCKFPIAIILFIFAIYIYEHGSSFEADLILYRFSYSFFDPSFFDYAKALMCTFVLFILCGT